MPKSYTPYFQHILDECLFIQNHLSGVIMADFLEDEVAKRAIVRSLEIIGEATRNIPADIKLAFPDIEWKSMAGLRNRLIHEYMGVNYVLVWDVAKHKIPFLTTAVTQAINKLNCNN